MDIVIRAAIAFIVLWLVTRAAGRSTLGELSSFELVLFVVMGDLVQQGITMEDRSLLGNLLAAFTMVLLAAILAYANMRWPKIGKLRSEEHTSELQSRENLVCRLLLE